MHAHTLHFASVMLERWSKYPHSVSLDGAEILH